MPEDSSLQLDREKWDALLCSREEKRVLELQNQQNVFRFVSEFQDAYPGRQLFSCGVIEELHRLTIDGIYPCAGNMRRHYTESVNVVGATFTPSSSADVPRSLTDLMERAQKWRQELSRLQEKDDSLSQVVEQARGRSRLAAEFLHRFLVIHPFQGGNGRVGRAFLHLLLYDMELLAPPTQIFDYIERRRGDYSRFLKVADEGLIEPFANYILRGTVEAGLFSPIGDLEDAPSFIVKRLDRESRKFLDQNYRRRLSDDSYVKRFQRLSKALDQIQRYLEAKHQGGESVVAQ